MSRRLNARNDSELLAAAGRDRAAFGLLYERHSAAVYSFALRRTSNRDVALDVVAETFARAWFARRRFRDAKAGSALPWLYGIAANVLRESARRQRIADSAVQRLGMATRTGDVLFDDGWDEGLDVELERALDLLTADQRNAVERRVIHGDDYDEIAADLDCSSGAARIRVSRGLNKMRRTLEER